ncbi:hypothetical protein D9M70_560290 [compost metagenome]
MDGDFLCPFDFSFPHVDGQARRAKVHAGGEPVFDQDMRDPLGQKQVGRIADDQHNVVIAQHDASLEYPYRT